MAEVLATKGEFARLINVSPGRVSQMIAEGKIGPDALEGEGRTARIRVEVAKRSIADRTDIGQRFGNGLDTQLQLQPVEPAGAPRAQPAPPPPSDPMAEAIKRERLRGLQLQNERLAEERLAEQGRYVRTDQTQAAMTRMAASILTVFEGGLADIASAISAETGAPARDILHRMRTEFVKIRAQAAESFRRDLANLPRLTADDIPDASDPAAGEA